MQLKCVYGACNDTVVTTGASVDVYMCCKRHALSRTKYHRFKIDTRNLLKMIHKSFEIGKYTLKR